MLSRVADALYWMSRYMERAENVARFVDVNLHMSLDIPGSPSEQWGPLVAATGDRDAYAARYGEPTGDQVVRFLTFDTENPNSILSCVTAARENARSARQFLTLEMWEQLNQHYLRLKDAAARGQGMELPHEFFTDVMMASQLFQGITDATMSHGEGWNWCRVGRKLERADKTSRILDVKYFVLLPRVADVGTPYDDLLWAAVLRSTSAFEMYRKRHHQISPERVVEFLVLDQEFPRAIHNCVIGAEESVRAISGTPAGSFRNLAEQRLGKLRAELDYARVEEIIEGGLHEFLDGLQTKVNAAGSAIQDVFFALRPLGTGGQAQAMQ
ncbi:MAG: alpha-E domain-containing protein [Deferrisomatales bacterium]